MSGIPTHVLEGEPQTLSPSSPSTSAAAPTVKKVEIPRRKIVDFDSIQYPEGVSKTPTNSSGKIQYDAEFLLQFKPLCTESSEDLSAFQNIGDDSNERGGSSRGGSMQRRQTSERGGRGPRTPGGDMYRNNSRDGRMDSMGKFAGGRPLAHRTGSGGIPSPGSPGGGMQRDGSHGGRSRSGRGGGKGRHPPREQQGGPTIPLDQVVPLEKSENRWTPTVVATGGEAGTAPVAKTEDELIPQEIIVRKVKSLLNKLTLEKFDSISDQIWEYAHQSAKEKDGQSLLTVIQLIFDKACDEAPFASMWAQLCRKLHDTMAAANDITDEDNLLDKNGKPITSGHLFRKYLFNRCQQAFERGWKFEIPDLEKSVSGEVMMTDEYYAAVKAKRQGLGLVQFIGELFKRGMLTDRIMTECLTRLCRNPQEAEDEETETMCKLVTTVGRELDRRNRNMKQWMDVFFDRMKEMLECTTLSSRVKFMIQDVIELRKNKWVPRSGGQTGPSTIAQIREEAQKAKNEEKESMKRSSSSRGNTPQVMSRQGSRAGRNNNIQREGSPSSNASGGGSGSPGSAAASTVSDGWSTVGTTPTATTPKGRTNELDGFGRTDRSKSRNNVLGPGSSPFQTLIRPGAKNAKSDSKKGSPADSRSSSPASSMSNMFSALGGGDEEHTEQRPERKKLNMLPRGSTLPIADEQQQQQQGEPETISEPSKPKLTEQQIEQKAKDIIEEFILLRDAKELEQCVKELEAPLTLVNKMLTVVEKKEDDVKGVCEMITILNKDSLISKDTYVEALKPFMEMYEDLTIDVPQAPKYMSQLLVAMNVDPAEVMEIEEPYDTGYVPASAKLKELYDTAKTSA
ncbi:armadillo-type protein [Halteromyces radiatus]|uniref:armadillo-type protein n=1 Tax=Halteromyces radiatus TaxID=101107 RepID=UPI00221F8FB4|nr:armadillo-type protein [Halteromyces radiatus]KAI8096882.1 armadillo-type protein [Halteromyces radiatus]